LIHGLRECHGGHAGSSKKLVRLPVSVEKKYAQHYTLLFRCHSGAVTIDSGLVTGHSWSRYKIGHDRPESAVTTNQNRRSRSAGMTDHDRPEYPPQGI
jgi:hypothetical protein